MKHAKFHYNKTNIIESLHEAGLSQGDTAYFSTSLGMLGQAENITSEQDLCNLHYNAIAETIGESGTILVPTYSYSFGGSTIKKPKIYDLKETLAEIGPFPNYFMSVKDTVRSIDPMVSMTALGPLSQQLFASLPKNSYGRNSVYERLLDIRYSKCVSIGLGPNWTPFIHYADYLSKVPFRYDKIFFGGIKDYNNKIEYTHWLYTVPARIANSFANAHKIGNEAAAAGIWKYANLGRARVYVCSYKDYFEFAIKKLQKNPWAFAVGPRCDVVKEDQKKLPNIALPNTESKVNPINIYTFFGGGIKNAISYKTKAIFNYLETHYQVVISEFQTGTNVLDWVIPEQQETKSDKDFHSMGKLQIGILNKNKQESSPLVSFVCYLSDKIDKHLTALSFLLDYIEKWSNKVDYCQFIFLPNHLGWSSYLQQLDKKDTAKAYIHLTDLGGNNTNEIYSLNYPENQLEMLIKKFDDGLNITNYLKNKKHKIQLDLIGNNPNVTKNMLDFNLKQITFSQKNTKAIEEKNLDALKTYWDNWISNCNQSTG